MRPPETENAQRNLAQRTSPRLKLAVAFLLIAAVALMPRRPHPLYLLPAAVLTLLWLLSRMPFGYVVRRLVLVEFLILGIVLLSLMTPSALPVVLAVLLKSNLCVLAMLLLTWTTPFHEILQVLRQLRLPPVMLSTLALMYRYLPVVAEESRRMQRARACRTFKRSHRLAWHSLTEITGQLFVRTAERAQRIYLAMCARGWK